MKEKASNLCEQKSFFKCLYNMPFLKMYLFCRQAFESAACLAVYIYNAFSKIVNINFSIS